MTEVRPEDVEEAIPEEAAELLETEEEEPPESPRNDEVSE